VDANELEKNAPKRNEKTEILRSEQHDIFIAHSVFPDASAVFTSRPGSLSEVKDKACIVLDTNALLVPYGIGAQTLAEVEATYRKLIKEARFFIPAQVAREFARNRVTKLTELYQRLSRRRSQLQPFQQGSYPLLEKLQEYQRVRKIEAQLDTLIADYRQSLTAVIDHVTSWEWNDPVSLLYGKLFSPEVVIDSTKPLDEIRQEHRRRFVNKIPPGYKDEAKDDQGIGDLLIWLTILEIGSKRQASVIFVSGEEKADWWHRSENQQLYPRFELVDEFRRASKGQSFHIIKFSRLLELFGASTAVVAEIREEERMTTPTVPLTSHAEMRMRGIAAEQSVAKWLIESGYKLLPAPTSVGYDFVAERGEHAFAVDIILVRSEISASFLLKRKAERYRERKPDLPVTLVAVAESPDIVEKVERIWIRLDPPFRLSTGWLDANGIFQVIKPL